MPKGQYKRIKSSPEFHKTSLQNKQTKTAYIYPINSPLLHMATKSIILQLFVGMATNQFFSRDQQKCCDLPHWHTECQLPQPSVSDRNMSSSPIPSAEISTRGALTITLDLWEQSASLEERITLTGEFISMLSRCGNGSLRREMSVYSM